jgi:hypothetical protein
MEEEFTEAPRRLSIIRWIALSFFFVFLIFPVRTTPIITSGEYFSAVPAGSPWNIENAIHSWGLPFEETSNIDEAEIVFVEAYLDSKLYGIAERPIAWFGFDVKPCIVYLNFLYRDSIVNEMTATHEVGHCLGLEHGETDGIMMDGWGEGRPIYTVPQESDLDRLEDLHNSL